MWLNRINRPAAALALGASAIIALGTLTACSSGAPETPASSAVAMPAAATYIADMPEQGTASMTAMAITVEGDKVIAYATNGSDDDAYFFGTQRTGQMDLTSNFGDHLTASFDGTKVDGEMTMNEDGATQQKFAASSVAAPAGLYTATHDNARASFIVRPDRSLVGVMDNSAPGDHKVSDQAAAQNQEFKDRVRQMRLDRQMRPAPQMNVGTLTMTMNGTPVTAVRVTGDMSF